MTNIVVRRKPNVVVNPWNEMDRLFNSFFENPVRENTQTVRKPKVNVTEEDSGVTMTVELPGFAAEDLDIQVKENLLTIKALNQVELDEEGKEKERTAAFERSFVLPEDFNRENIKAEMKNGLLTLNLMKKEKPAPLAIKVKG